MKNKNYRYSFTLTFGNDATVEANMIKERVSMFFRSFDMAPVFCRMDDDEMIPRGCYYLVQEEFESRNFLQVLNLAESLRSFCLFHRINLNEYSLLSI